MAYKGFILEEKLKAVLAYENGESSSAQLAVQYGISLDTVKAWISQYQEFGIPGLEPSAGWKSYPEELKLEAINDYQIAGLSQRQIVIKYGISDRSVFRQWLKKYNGHGEVPKGRKERRVPMTRGRKTTWKERIEIAQQCIAAGKDYQGIAEKYEVSYNQVYQWVKKYETGHVEALRDGRGRKKEREELTNEERLKLEIKRIERENERLRAQNALLKKLEEIERRRL
ncbi:helix-turn-helix domain-containing protein [Edaphobacillus lindanitolerans]|uniref:Transposase and inactivated derivatives n=1 Tax=Edaphobacillus lindanitolerans TaxID=550447 RepID=A0A1U7PMD9_9BACI|nr:helix-turn-helix domain-containing protein [Edaphobacillus lindanitolerans]SIT90688.1 Transposase and inactivated derivatives [Edaphobacillus lindanitolerans]